MKETVQELPQIYQIILSLHYVDGLSIDEIAEVLEQSPIDIFFELQSALKIVKNSKKVLH